MQKLLWNSTKYFNGFRSSHLTFLYKLSTFANCNVWIKCNDIQFEFMKGKRKKKISWMTNSLYESSAMTWILNDMKWWSWEKAFFLRKNENWIWRQFWSLRCVLLTALFGSFPSFPFLRLPLSWLAHRFQL